MRTLRVWTMAVAVMIAALPAQANPVFGFIAHLHGADEVPAVLSPGGGAFRATFAVIDPIYAYRVHYFGLKGNVTEVDINLAQPGANGGVMVVLCSNLPSAPAGTQPCPTALPATIAGQIPASAVVGGAAAQGVVAGDLAAFAAALDAGLAYVTIRTDLFPEGEVRGQVSGFVISPA